MTLPRDLYDAAGVRALDRAAIDDHGIAGIELMNRAGLAAFRCLRERWPRAARIAVVCGAGNNAGDGYVVARLAQAAGLTVELFQVGAVERLRGDALTAHEAMADAGIAAREGLALTAADVVVDALFGTGLDRPLAPPFDAAVEAINAAPAPVLSLDIPSGLNASTGAVDGPVVGADATITFIGCKLGLVTGAGPDCCGELYFDALEVPAAVYASVPPVARRIRLGEGVEAPPPRPRTAHKGNHGHVLVVGGAPGYAGAAALAGEAALRSGAGLVSVATHPASVALIAARRPELMVRGVESAAALAALLERATVVAIGPGLDRLPWSERLLDCVLESRRPLVVDADALNLLADNPTRRDDWVLTPHPGEAARLLGGTTAEVQRDRLAAALTLHQRYGGSVILKGAGTVVVAPGDRPAVIAAGNPGMGSGGMGDVLTGVVAALAAQGVPLAQAARLGAAVHAAAGDECAGSGERGLLAGDLAPVIRRLLNPPRA